MDTQAPAIYKFAKYKFANFEMDCARRVLLRDGEPLPLYAKAFDLLQVFVEDPARLISKDELMERVWPDQFVEENNLTVQISALRKIFGETKGQNEFIATVQGKGYSFVAEIESLNSHHNADIASTASELIGRASEVAEIVALLSSADTRLVTLTGTGGTGKTTLALAVVDQMRSINRDGACFVELAAITDPDLLVPAVAEEIGVKESGGRTAFELLLERLEEKRSLLVLDNFEQIVSAAPKLTEFLGAMPKLKILVTSRVPLHLEAEREFNVRPLDLPPADSRISLDDLNANPSVKLFVARARDARAAFVLSDANAADVAAICRRLDGLPLAIELAAARVKLLSPRSILERLQQSLKILTGGRAKTPAHQQTMRDTIRWSYDLLENAEQELFRRLAVFTGGFTVDAAEFVAVGTEPSALDVLTSLTEKNLLNAVEQPDGNARLYMLEVVREFALEYLDNSEETRAARQSHAEFFLSLAEEAEPHMFSGQSKEWMGRLEAEHDNLRSALEWLLESEPEKAARMATALGQFWISRAYLTEARRWLEAALQKYDGLTNTRFKLLNTFSLIARNQGDYAATRRAAEESLSASRSANNLPQIILSCDAVAALETREGNFQRARELFEEALAISRELGDEKQVAFSLSYLGNLFLAANEPAAARSPIEESLAISRRLGLTVNISTNLTNLGAVAFYAGEIDESSRHFLESLTICREIGNGILVSCCLDGLGAVAASKTDMPEAARLAGAADGLRRTLGYEIELAEQLFRDAYADKARTALGEDAFTALYEEGQAMDLDEAIARVSK